MIKLPGLLLVFTLAFAAFIVGPAFLGGQFRPYPLMKVGDVLDLLTPLVLIPLYWLMLQSGPHKSTGLRAGLPFMLLSALWVEGQGLHLGANSIGHLLEGGSARGAFTLTYFYDEVLSHYLWHLGIMGLSALLVVHAWRQGSGERFSLGLTGAAGAIHGFTFFLVVVEGGTAPLGVPFAVLFALFGMLWGRQRLKGQPLLAFFFVAYLVAALFFLGWFLYWGGLPQFSQVGIID